MLTDVVIILRFGETKVAKEKIYGAKKVIKIWYVRPNNIVISKLIKIKTKSKDSIGYLDIVMRPIVLILSKMGEYVKTLKVEDVDKDKSNKFISLDIDDDKPLDK